MDLGATITFATCSLLASGVALALRSTSRPAAAIALGIGGALMLWTVVVAAVTSWPLFGDYPSRGELRVAKGIVLAVAASWVATAATVLLR